MALIKHHLTQISSIAHHSTHSKPFSSSSFSPFHHHWLICFQSHSHHIIIHIPNLMNPILGEREREEEEEEEEESMINSTTTTKERKNRETRQRPKKEKMHLLMCLFNR